MASRRPKDPGPTAQPRIEGLTIGTLFVVATPIGNLEDITLRALRTLREVAVVAAEDTRRTSTLLRHYQIQKPLLSLHHHNEARRLPQLLERLRAGQSVALVSDAGTPAISDPGAGLVRAARAAEIPVVPIPGPSAVTAVLSASGVSVDRFAFGGFPPIRSKDRKCWFSWVRSLAMVPVICFEAPHRLQRTLAEIAHELVNRPIIAAREVTKIHEEWRAGTPAELAQHFSDPLGEFVLIILPETSNDVARDLSINAAAIAAVFGQIPKIVGVGRRVAIRETAKKLGLSSRAVYEALEEAKNLVKQPN